MSSFKSSVYFVFFTFLIAIVVAARQPVVTQQTTQPPGPAHFHHIHLNSMNPSAAVEFYSKAIPSATKATLAGFEGIKTGNIYVLFTKVNRPPAVEPQSAIWHFGWQTPDSRQYLDRYHAMKMETIPMYASADGPMIEITSDTFPGYLTQPQIAEAKAKGTMPTKVGGFAYLKGPDGGMFEDAGNAPERFDHVHMYHAAPLCAQEWYVKYLGAALTPPGRGGAGAAAPAGTDCNQPYGDPSWPSTNKGGTVRVPTARVYIDDVSLTIIPRQGSSALISSRGQVVDHIGLGVADLAGSVERMKRDGVKVLEDVQRWGDTQAAMVEGPDHVALELVQAR